MDSEPFDITFITQHIIDRFWSRVTKTDTCWIWQGKPQINTGYGRMFFNHKEHLAHRLAYMIQYQIDPFPYDVLHTCDNPLCVKKEHLFLGNAKTNAEDRQNKLRQARGNSHGKAIIREEDIPIIRKYISQGIAYKEIARCYRVNPSTIQRIATRETWGWI